MVHLIIKRYVVNAMKMLIYVAYSVIRPTNVSNVFKDITYSNLNVKNAQKTVQNVKIHIRLTVRDVTSANATINAVT
jgi:hypothetical protein